MSIWLIGAGPMALDYANVLKALDIDFEVIGRGERSATAFANSIEMNVSTGGIRVALNERPAPKIAIVAVGVEQLASVATELIESGTRSILLEKPGGLNLEQIRKLNDLASVKKTDVWIAYNRRFYASVLKAEELIALDGGMTSVQYEFTEWSHVIRDLPDAKEIKESLFLNNSTHVVDLVFHLSGIPHNWKCWHSGTIEWHPTAARFSGAGISNRGVMFSYLADWEAPGRWGIEILTKAHRFILRPMEELKMISLGSVQIESIEIDDSLDKQFKPGLFLQTDAFLKSDTDRLCSLKNQMEHIGFYNEISGYDFTNSSNNTA
jgi:hypothetical protein